MCWKTDAGLVQSVGEIRLEVSYGLPEFLQNFRYVIFKEEADMLGLIYHTVCIDLVLDSRGMTPAEACKGLKNSIYSLIDAMLRRITDKSKVFDALKEQKENRDETRELIYRAYNEVLTHNETILYAKLRPHFKTLYDSLHLKFQNVSSYHEFSHYLTFYNDRNHRTNDNKKQRTNLFAVAYNEEEIKKLYKMHKSSKDAIKEIITINYCLCFNICYDKISRQWHNFHHL